MTDENGGPTGGDLAYRQRRPVRLWNWGDALAVIVILMSGLMIFNAHPRLYCGQYGANFETPWLEIGSTGAAGYLRLGSATIATMACWGCPGASSAPFRRW